jgi:ParB family chromosome partitioning protein
MSTATAVVSKFQAQEIAIASLFESKTNPRQVYDPAKMAETVASMKVHGVLQPIMVRAVKGGKYEIVCGSRRYRAAKEAGLDKMPCSVRDLTDAQVLEIQLIENAVREDVHPLHEGQAYARLLKFPNYTAEIIAQKTGHDLKTIHQRLKLVSLNKKAQDLFIADEINIGHANLLARLPEDKQAAAVKDLLFRDESEWDENTRQHVRRKFPRSVKDFDEQIRRHLLLDLQAAPWKKDDEGLFAEAGSCTKCPKRTGANKLLFDDLGKREACLDSQCYQKKGELFIIRAVNEAKDSGLTMHRISQSWQSPHDEKRTKAMGTSSYRTFSKADKECSGASDGIYVDGSKFGQVIRICADPKCKTHWARDGYSSSRAGGPDKKKDFWEERAKALPKKINLVTRRAALKALLAVPIKYDLKTDSYAVPATLLRTFSHPLLGYSVIPELGELLPTPIDGKGRDVAGEFKRRIAAPKSLELPNLVTALALQEVAKEWGNSDYERLLQSACKDANVPYDKIAKEIDSELRAEFNAKRHKAKAKAKAEAKKAAPAPKAKKGGKK